KSTDQGRTFSSPQAVAVLNTRGLNGDLGLEFRTNAFPTVAVNPVSGALYVAYNDAPNDGTGTRANVYFTQSTDGGKTWSSAVQVNDDATHHDHWAPAISVNGNGSQLFIGWYDRRLDSANKMIDVFGTVGNIDATTGSVSLTSNFRLDTAWF